MLRPMVVMVDFQKGGKTVFTTVNFAGYVGALTGIKSVCISLSKLLSNIWLTAQTCQILTS